MFFSVTIFGALVNLRLKCGSHDFGTWTIPKARMIKIGRAERVFISASRVPNLSHAVF